MKIGYLQRQFTVFIEKNQVPIKRSEIKDLLCQSLAGDFYQVTIFVGFKFSNCNINSLDCLSRGCFYLLEKSFFFFLENSLSPCCASVLYSFMRWSVRCGHKRGHRTDARKQHFLYTQVPERQGHEGASRGERHGSWLSQVGGELRKSEGLRACEGQGGVLSKKCQRIASVCLDVTRYRGGQEGELLILAGVSLITLVYPVTCEGCSLPLQGDAEAARKQF